MSTSCHIVYDLLPLYVDGACSDESRAYVEEHLAGCPACRKKYEAMADTVDVLLRKPEYVTKNEEAMEPQQIDRTSKRVLKRLKRRWLTSLLPLLLLGINQYRGVGLSFNNLYDHYAAGQFLKALEKREYERAFTYLNMDYYYYEDIQRGLKHSADMLAFKEEGMKEGTDEQGRRIYMSGEAVFSEEQYQSIVRQYQEFPESRAADKQNALNFIAEYEGLSYEQFYERSKSNFIANMKEWEKLGHTLKGHQVDSSYTAEYDGGVTTTYSFRIYLTDGTQDVRSGTIHLGGNHKGSFTLSGGAYFAEKDSLTPKLLDSLSIHDLE